MAATEFPPTLRLNALGGKYVAPEVLHFPDRGKLRVGYHPPYMDNGVGTREFAKLPYQDVRGDDDAVRDLSRHVACIWRDPRTNDCYIQLGWPGRASPSVPSRRRRSSTSAGHRTRRRSLSGWLTTTSSDWHQASNSSSTRSACATKQRPRDAS